MVSRRTGGMSSAEDQDVWRHMTSLNPNDWRTQPRNINAHYSALVRFAINQYDCTLHRQAWVFISVKRLCSINVILNECADNQKTGENGEEKAYLATHIQVLPISTFSTMPVVHHPPGVCNINKHRSCCSLHISAYRPNCMAFAQTIAARQKGIITRSVVHGCIALSSSLTTRLYYSQWMIYIRDCPSERHYVPNKQSNRTQLGFISFTIDSHANHFR